MSDHQVVLVEMDKCRRSKSGRQLDEAHAKSLATNIKDIGLLQAIIVITADDGFNDICIGNHRHRAAQILGWSHIPARILTPEKDELVYSLVSNNLCRDESPEDIVKRVDELANRLGISFAKAAEIAHVKPATYSRFKKIVSTLTAEARQFADEHKLGMSIQYEVARHAATQELQMAALKAVQIGVKRDQLPDWFAAHSPEVPKKVRTAKLKQNHNGIRLQLDFPEDATYEQITEALKHLKTALALQQKRDTPVDLLPRYIK